MPAYHQSMTHSFNSNRKPTTSLLFLQAFLDVLLDIARTLHQCLTPRVLEIWPAWHIATAGGWPTLIYGYFTFPQTVCEHRRVLTVGVKAGLDQGAHSGLWHFTCKFRKKWLLWNLDVRFDCAGSHKVCGAVLVCGVLPVNFRKKWLLWHVDLRFDCAGSHKVWS